MLRRLQKLQKAILTSPFLWGSLATAGFYVPIHTGHWTNAFVLRYFAGHPVEHVAMFLFCVGVSAAIIKAFDLASQFQLLESEALPPARAGGDSVADCGPLLAEIAKKPFRFEDSYLIRRLREALEHVSRSGSAATLDDQLRHLSEIDVARMHASYALIRIIIWAIPILGLLGTVIGITAAVGNLSAEALESSISHVTAGLAVAFDHTALALGLSIGLMFSQFLVERYENRLLGGVDAQVARELVGRFAQTAVSSDPQSSAVHQAAKAMIDSTEKLVVRQSEIWQNSIEAAQKQWAQTASSAGRQLESALAAAISTSVKEHATALAAAEKNSAEQNRRHWSQVQDALLKSAEAVTLQQRELARQGDILKQVVEATGQVAKLETELNRNLGALAGSNHFEQTVISLSAAIHLLNVRLAQSPVDGPRVELKSAPRAGQAA